MVETWKHGAYLLNGTELIEDIPENQALLAAKLGQMPDAKTASEQTMAYHILQDHNLSLIHI